MKEVLENLREDTKLGGQYLFKYAESDGKFNISIYPPLQTSGKEKTDNE